MYKNHVRSILSSPVTVGATSIQIVKSVSPYQQPPTDGYMTITDSLTKPTKIEIISYTALTDNGSYWTLTGVVRGLGGTTAQSHAIPSVVYQAVFADDLVGGGDSALNQKIITGTMASTSATSVSVSHGLTYANIVAATALVVNGSNMYHPGNTNYNSKKFSFEVRTTVVSIYTGSSATNIYGKPFTVVLTYT